MKIGKICGSLAVFVCSVAFGLAQTTGATGVLDETSDENKSERKMAELVDKSLPKLPVGITSFGGAVVGESLYVFGGHCGDAHDYYRSGQNGTLYRLNLKDPQTWELVDEGTGMQGLAMVQHNGTLYRVGGFEARNKKGEDHDLHSTDLFARFDVESASWISLTPLPEPRSSLDAVVVDDTLYVVGGWTLSGDTETVWREEGLSLDLSKRDAKWQRFTVPFQRRALSLGHRDGKLYVVGGMQKEGGPTSKVQVYDLKSKIWSEGPKLPGDGKMEGFGSSCFDVGGKLVASTYSGSVLVLNSDGNGWDEVHKFNPGRFFHRLLPVSSDSFLLVGGANMGTGKIMDVPVLRLK